MTQYKEKDYLERLKDAKAELTKLCNQLQIIPQSSCGQAMVDIFELLNKEIQHIEYIRQF